MQELMGTARNLSLVMSTGKPQASVEVILITCEPMFSVDGGGIMVQTRVPSTVRFSTSPDNLREVCDELVSFADEADAMLARVEVSAIPTCPPELGD